MNTSTVNSYYYGDESNQFSFFRIPRQLITGERFKHISTDAKLLYGLLLDRMGLSEQNGWYDENGRVYIYYTLREIQQNLNCGQDKAKADPRRFMSRNAAAAKSRPLPKRTEVKTSEIRTPRLPKTRLQDFRFSEVLTSEKPSLIILRKIRLI